MSDDDEDSESSSEWSSDSSSSSIESCKLNPTIAINNDFAYDGMWSFSGFGGMMVKLAEDFVKSKQELSGNTAEIQDEAIFLNLRDINPTNEEAIIRIHEHLEERDLHMADGVLRRILEGCCPPQLEITRLDEQTTMTQLLNLKLEGNQHFVERGYREAIYCYDASLESIPLPQRSNLFVAPKHQIREIVNILSNKAECLLRKAKYEEAAEAATEALVFDSSHEKSRLRRAKACLEIGMYDRFEASSRGDKSLTGVACLVQAKYDLEEILRENPTTDGRKAAQSVHKKVEKLLEGAKKKVLDNDPETEWDMAVLKIESKCW